MKVLLTGATGFVGRYVIKELEAQDIDFVSIGRTARHSGKQYVVTDLLTATDLHEILKKVKATHLIHLAWYAEHGKYWESPINLDWMAATYRLLDAFCKSGGEHALIAGTCAEYDWRYGLCDEQLTPTNPGTLYGIVKDSTRRMSESLCSRHGVGRAWARIFFPYGSGESETRLIPSLFKVFRNEKPLFGVNGQSYRDLLHVSDLAGGLLMCSTKKFSGVVNISSGEPIAISEVVKNIANIHHKDPAMILDIESERKGDPTFLVGCNQVLKSLGWKQKIGIDEGLLNY